MKIKWKTVNNLPLNICRIKTTEKMMYTKDVLNHFMNDLMHIHNNIGVGEGVDEGIGKEYKKTLYDTKVLFQI